MTNSDTIEIRRRDMVTSCPIADDIKRLRDNNAYLLEELEKERAKVTKLEDTIKCYKALNQELIATRASLSKDLDEYRAALVTARASRDVAEEDAGNFCEQLTKARGALRDIKFLILKYEEVPIDAIS